MPITNKSSLDVTNLGQPVAPFWARCLAFIIDAVALNIFWYAVWVYARPVATALGGLFVPVQYMSAFIYFFLLDGLTGTPTLGKMALNLQTVDRESLGRVAPKQAAIRSMVKVLAFAIIASSSLLLPGLDASTVSFGASKFLLRTGLSLLIAQLAMVVLQPAKQSVHDWLAGTVVGRDPVGEAMGDYLAEVGRMEAQFQIQPVRTIALIAVIVAGMTSCDVRTYNQSRSTEMFQKYQGFIQGATEAVAPDGVQTDILISPIKSRRLFYHPDFTYGEADGLTTYTAVVRLLGSPPTNKPAEDDLTERGERLEGFFLTNPEQFQDVAFSFRNEAGEITAVKHFQMQRLMVQWVQQTSLFAYIPLEQVLASVDRDVAIPPNQFIERKTEDDSASALSGDAAPLSEAASSGEGASEASASVESEPDSPPDE